MDLAAGGRTHRDRVRGRAATARRDALTSVDWGRPALQPADEVGRGVMNATKALDEGVVVVIDASELDTVSVRTGVETRVARADVGFGRKWIAHGPRIHKAEPRTQAPVHRPMGVA